MMPKSGRAFFAPEVIQSSAMDCGPAALKSILAGFGLSVDYGLLREACLTDVDGTSTDDIESIARALGLSARQLMAPPDHLPAAPSAFIPAVVVTKLQNGAPHFVVLWRRHRNVFQVMDPARGRRFISQKQFLREVLLHEHLISERDWLEWTAGDGFKDPLRARMNRLGISPETRNRLIREATGESWLPAAALDAAVRLTTTWMEGGAVSPGAEAGTLLSILTRRATSANAVEVIPESFWTARPAPAGDDNGETRLRMRGIVLIRVSAPDGKPERVKSSTPLSATLSAALHTASPNPAEEIKNAVSADGSGILLFLAPALLVSVSGILFQTLFLRGILDFGRLLPEPRLRFELTWMVCLLLATLLAHEIPVTGTIRRLGRRMETRFRTAFLEKLPRLGERFFQSRLASDLVQRAYDLGRLRLLPELLSRLIRQILEIILMTIGIGIIHPQGAGVAVAAALFFTGAAAAAQPVLKERDLRVRTLTGAINRFYLDALQGIVPIRAHAGERRLMQAHEAVLVDRSRAENAFQTVDTLVIGLETCLGALFSFWMVHSYIQGGNDISGVLLLCYWSLSLPRVGCALAETAHRYPAHRNRVMRYLETLTATEEAADFPPPAPNMRSDRTPAQPASGVDIEIQNGRVSSAGRTILTGINLKGNPGEHIAVVGPSGAGKSTLAGLLLGRRGAVSGTVKVDHAVLTHARLKELRRETAWIDPSVAIWNRTLAENLRYGNGPAPAAGIEEILECVSLKAAATQLPGGTDARLGEGGGLLSGGEGQRVRIGRAFGRPGVRLAVLDEPFRGLDRPLRERLLREARERFGGATLFFISHRITESLEFPRVIVMEGGCIVEDGPPERLLADPDSRYHRMLTVEAELRAMFSADRRWRRFRMESGHLTEAPVPDLERGP